MNGRDMRHWSTIVIAMAVIGLIACNPMNSSQQGHGVVLEGQPRIYKQEVYYHGQTIGKILDQKIGKEWVQKITIQLLPDHQNIIGSNWVFYVDQGRLNAFKIAAFGKPLPKGANICGFSSKAALNWFRFKTLLTNRIYRANQIADALTRRFG
jgi:hypothetical protein